MWVTPLLSWALMLGLHQQVTPPNDIPVPALIGKLGSKNAVERQEAAYDLGLRGAMAASAVPPLLALLRNDPEEDVRVAATYALARAGQQDKAVVPALIEALQGDSKASVRFSAAIALGDLGPSAKAAIPALAKALKDSDRSVRLNAATALGQFGSDETADRALWQALEDKSKTVRVVASMSLLKGKPQKREPFVVLLGAIKRNEDLKNQEDKDAFFAAAGFLKNINGNNASMAPALADALGDKNAHVRHAAAYTLGLIGPPAKAAIPVLKKALTDEDGKVRESAAQALAKIEATPSNQ